MPNNLQDLADTIDDLTGIKNMVIVAGTERYCSRAATRTTGWEIISLM